MARWLVAAAAISLLACFSERGTLTGTEQGGLCDGARPDDVVRIVNASFQPATLTVAAGTRVTFVNCNTQSHTATADDFDWDSGLISPDFAYSRTFDTPGTEAYHCEPHPFMTARIVVQ